MKKLNTYDRRKSEGMCPVCGKCPPRDADTFMCADCAKESSERGKTNAKKNIKNGLCPCGNPRAGTKYKRCQSCLDGKKMWAENRKRNGICLKCTDAAKPNRLYCGKHLLWRRIHDLHISPEEGAKARAAVESFDGICQNPNCGATTPGDTRDWHLDHCHETKKFRGILCAPCNHLLGCARDSVHVLAGAIEYLERFSSSGDFGT